MAAAILPLVTAIAPEIINLITALVHKSAPVAEQLGSGTGPVKFAQVFSDVIMALQKAAAAGQIPKDLPSDDLVKVVIQAAVNSLQLAGALTASPVAQSSTTRSVSVSGTLQVSGAL